jgi:hypothetical protein
MHDLDRGTGDAGGMALWIHEFYAAQPLSSNAPIQKSGATD